VAEEALTIRQAAGLLVVHPNTVRNRIKSGRYKADKVVTENGETYLISRSELEKDLPTNSLATPSPSQQPSQPLPDVREAMQAMLEPFVRELGEVREELGREKERRERAEKRIEELERLLEPREAPNTVEETSEPPESPEAAEEQQGRGESHPATVESQGGARRPWWRRLLGG
jgi:excisionase family DNA binding protein